MDTSCDLICFSHHAWDDSDHERDVLAQAAQDRRVFFVEEPIFERGPAFLSTRRSPEGVTIVQAGLPEGTEPEAVPELVRDLLERLMDEEDITYCTVKFDEPRAAWFTDTLAPAITDDAPAWTSTAAVR